MLEQSFKPLENKQQLLVISEEQIKEMTINVIFNLEKTGYFGHELIKIIHGHIHEGIAEYSEAFSPEKSLELIEQWEKKVKFYKEKIQQKHYSQKDNKDCNLDEIALDLLKFYNEQHLSFKSVLKLTFFEIMSVKVKPRDKYYTKLQDWIWRLMIENSEKMN